MTLTLDEVRKTKFHMARRTGYEVSEVDLFVDRVEASFAQLTEENQMLKQQVEALKQSPARQPRQDQRADDSAVGANQQPAKASEAQPAKPAAAASQGVQKLVVATSAEASPAVIRLVQLATDQSEQLVNEATDDAKRKIDEANRKAEQITSEARSAAQRLEQETKANAERTTSEAGSRAADLDRQTGLRRTELFASLEQERDQLQEAVGKLRGFEASYRQSFVKHLKDQLQAVESVTVEPASKPELADRAGSNGRPARADQSSQNSNTPRLDALLNDSRRKG